MGVTPPPVGPGVFKAGMNDSAVWPRKVATGPAGATPSNGARCAFALRAAFDDRDGRADA